MINKITPSVDLSYWLEQTNQNTIKVPKVLRQQRKHRLSTSVIDNPLASPLLASAQVN